MHPSKIVKLIPSSSSELPSTTENVESESNASDTETNKVNDCDYTYEPPTKVRRTRPYHNTRAAVQLVKEINLSSSKSAKVCRQLSDHGIEIPTPTQPGIYMASL